jgi:glycosyltransferase involved in cell wall biosynthesis
VHDEEDRNASVRQAQFIKLIEDSGLEKCVAYHGVVVGRRKEELIKLAHLFVLPTSYPWEGQPISIIEALAFGTPVVATRYRGIPEQVIDGYNGFLVAPNAPEDIAGAVKKIATDSDLYSTLSRNAISHFQGNFTQEVHLHRLISVILNDC